MCACKLLGCFHKSLIPSFALPGVEQSSGQRRFYSKSQLFVLIVGKSSDYSRFNFSKGFDSFRKESANPVSWNIIASSRDLQRLECAARCAAAVQGLIHSNENEWKYALAVELRLALVRSKRCLDENHRLRAGNIKPASTTFARKHVIHSHHIVPRFLKTHAVLLVSASRR